MIAVTRPQPPKPHPFKTYKDKHVVAALSAMFRGKCAYCECEITASGPIEVEHYRPKGRVVEADGKVRSGYAWLKLEWSNLLASCIDCNRERYQELIMPAGARSRRKTGKACKFPLRDPRARARKKGEEAAEAPLLLNPCEPGVKPEQHLSFTADGSIAARRDDQRGTASDRGLATIEVAGLHRSGLVEWRRKRLLELEQQIQKVCERSWRLATDPADPFHAQDRQDELTSLEDMANPEKCYAGMAAQVVRHFKTVLPLLEEFLAVQLGLQANPNDPTLLQRETAVLARFAPLTDLTHPFREITQQAQDYLFGKLPNP